jgi:hypothetical protein
MPLPPRRHIPSRVLVLVAMCAVVGSGCGDHSDRSYSATRFAQCLEGRGVTTQSMDTSPSQNRYFDVLHRLAAEAGQQNGALEAFNNDSMPNASTIYFLFFRDGSAASRAEKRLGAVSVRQDDLAVDGNLLRVASSLTDAQRRIVQECLDKGGS